MSLFPAKRMGRAAACLACWAWAVSAGAYEFGQPLPEAGDKFIRARVISIAPRGESQDLRRDGDVRLPGTALAFDNALGLELGLTYKLDGAWATEITLGLPVEQDIRSSGAALAAAAPGTVIQARLAPLTAMLQYHLNPEGQVRPYAGLGVNYGYFFSPKSTYALDKALGGTDRVSLDNAYGWAAQVGMDWALGEDWALNFDVKYVSMQTALRFTSGQYGALESEIDLNPWLLGIGVGRKF